MLKFGNVLGVKKNAIKLMNEKGEWIAVDMCLVEVIDEFNPKWKGLNIARCENGRPVGKVDWRAMSVSHVNKVWKNYSAK